LLKKILVAKSLILSSTAALAVIFVLGSCKEEISIKAPEEVVKADTLKTARSKEDYDEAISNYKELLEKEPDNLIVLISLGDAYFDMGMNTEAIKVYSRALSIYPDNVTVRTDLGTAYRRIGDSDRALEEYLKSLEADPRNSTTRYNIGVVLLWDKKDVAGAIKVWKELLRIDPYFVLADEVKHNIRALEKMKEHTHKQ
jgi:tetratricopeptide (TPR) repeat protein